MVNQLLIHGSALTVHSSSFRHSCLTHCFPLFSPNWQIKRRFYHVKGDSEQSEGRDVARLICNLSSLLPSLSCLLRLGRGQPFLLSALLSFSFSPPPPLHSSPPLSSPPLLSAPEVDPHYTILSISTLCQKIEKPQHASVGTVRMVIEPRAQH